MEMGLEITPLLHSNPMNVHLTLETRLKTVLDALMEMGTDGLMEEIGRQMIKNNGWILMAMDMEIIICIMKIKTSSTLIKEEMLIQIIQHNGMIPMVMDMEIILPIPLGFR